MNQLHPKRLVLTLVLVGAFIGALATTPQVARALATTVEVGGATVPVGESASVDVWVRSFPEGGYGLGCYGIRIDYDPTMLEVTGVSDGDAPFSAPIFNIFPDYVSVTQFIAIMPGPTGDIRLCDLEFNRLSPGETTLALTIEVLADTNGDEIPATPVNGIITQPGSPPTGGGGGGIGGGGVQPEPEPGVTNVSDVISDEGVFTAAATPTSEDGKVELTIEQDTVGLVDGEPLSEISVTEIEPQNLPIPPTDASVIGLAYDFGPDGAIFSQPVTLTFTYDPALVPEGIAEEDLVIALWDETTGEWIVLEGCTVDLENHTISAPVSHFTTFAVLARTRPAEFVTSDLSITPAEVDIGQSVTISLLVTNTGDLEGTYQVILSLDDQAEATQAITLRGGASQEVIFTTTRDMAGSYPVAVGGLTGSFVVKPAPLEPAAFTPSSLTISPVEVDINQTVNITVLVTNTGGEEGSYTVTLNINGVSEATRDITLNDGASKQVTFTTARDEAGSYSVDVNGLIGSFIVKKEALNWTILGPVMAVVVFLAIFLLIRLKRRTTAA